MLQVTAIFGTSMEVMISVCGESLAESSIFHCGDAYATVVTVDQHSLPVDIPFELDPKSPADAQRCAASQSRQVSVLSSLARSLSTSTACLWTSPLSLSPSHLQTSSAVLPLKAGKALAGADFKNGVNCRCRWTLDDAIG